MEENLSQSDHDLLIRIDTKLENLIGGNKDKEIRIRRLEVWGAIAIGFLYAIQFYINVLHPAIPH